MKTIIYKKRSKGYECTSISGSGISECKLIFEEPFDAKVKLGELIVDIKNGVGEFDGASFKSGEYAPLLIRFGEIIRMETLEFRDGDIYRPAVNDEFVRELSRRIEENSRLLCELEEVVNELMIKFSSTIDLY